ncbi:ABC transporter ATP-binding protein [Microbacteriaceae bacterium VKM Ac-2854]|nr:ABC transporter ATP-binding protein [Microbacteriaceae bacterium VKM Ac-2854]
MIQFDDVTLTFADGDSRLTALDRVSFGADPGTVTGITGPSGSGKSSLLAVAATLIRPDSGRVVIDDTDVCALSPKDAARLRRDSIGIVFQNPNLIASLTAREQLVVLNELRERGNRRGRAAIAARADELLETVGLGGLGDRRPHQLSGGQRQRVNIARALMSRPRVLLVDEPTSALDHERGQQIIALILRLTEEMQTATLLVTHEQAHLPQLSRVITLVDGAVAARGYAPAPS